MARVTDTIRQGDCIAGMRRLAPGSVDLVFADPPFNIGYQYDAYYDDQDGDTYLNWSREWIAAAHQALKPGGTFWIAIGDEYAAEIKLIAQNDVGLHCRSWVLWYYTFGVNCVRKFSRSHTHLFYFTKDPEQFTFNDDAIRVPSARQLVYNDKRANPRGRLPDDTWILRPQDVAASFHSHEDTWFFPRVCGTFKERAGWHGCQMPEQLLGRIIRCASNPGELVLDPFAGSGTTLAVAKKLGRRFLGFEISAEYVRQIRSRLRRISADDPLEGAEQPLASAPKTPKEPKPRQPRNGKQRNGKSRPAPNNTKTEPGESEPGQSEPGKSERVKSVRTKIESAAGTGLRQAYLDSCAGLSIDRVLADPEVNQAFIKTCRSLDIPGEPAAWNHQLLGLRKAGKLKGIPKPERSSTITDEDIEHCTFGSEIAWHLISHEHGLALDEIFCCPDLVQRFDGLAARLAPGGRPFHYRWAALRIRKKAKVMRSRAQDLPPETSQRKFDHRSVRIQAAPRVPEQEGLYLLKAARHDVYLGSTLDLRRRIGQHVDALAVLLSELHLEHVPHSEVRFKILPFEDGMPQSHKLGLQSLLLGRLSPLANANLIRQAFTA